MRLSELKTGDKAIILSIAGKGVFRKRILEMGFVQGKEVTVVQSAPLRDPIHYKILDYNVSLRREDAALIEVQLLDPSSSEDAQLHLDQESIMHARLEDKGFASGSLAQKTTTSRRSSPKQSKHLKRIRVALLGNPNCGKTSLFNKASGAHEHVGNYSGVTVEAKEGHVLYGGYRIDIIDLPGTYSLSPYSPEELYIRDYLSRDKRPDVVLNVVDTSNLERNLYLTVQLIEMGLPIVMALNMFDEFEKRGDEFDYHTLGTLLGIPMTPTNCRSGIGLEALFDSVIEVYEGKSETLRSIKIPYGNLVEPRLNDLADKIDRYIALGTQHISSRYLALKLLEQDKEYEDYLKTLPKGAFILSARDFALKQIDESLAGESDTESLLTDHRYGFIHGALKETFSSNRVRHKNFSERIDHFVTHQLWGFPIFLLIMYAMFQATFVLGEYPMSWIEDGVQYIGSLLAKFMPAGSLKDLLIDGVIGGVGGVLVFLPNILILYFFISLMEDSGYMSRAAFIMDKIMHKMGLHGKSFIPLIMGFGCNVPAIMATRSIESRQSRMITMLVLPLMSCSARLPVYLLLAGAFFPHKAGLVLFSLYLVGVLLAVLLARVFKKAFFNVDDLPFVMELPPYRFPTAKSVLRHMWDKARQYLQKMGTVILLASIVIWFLSYYPRYQPDPYQHINVAHSDRLDTRSEVQAKQASAEEQAKLGAIKQQEQSYIGRFGKAIQPALAPLGFDWKMSVSLLSGMAAKEVVVSTLGVIYTGDDGDDVEEVYRLIDRLRADVDSEGKHSFTPLVAYVFMIFVLIYFPCIATIIAIGRESGHWKWGIFAMFYTCALAWTISYLIYQGGQILGFA